MRISPVGLDLVKKHEGLRLKAYLCPAGVWTIGYGTTGPNIKPGMKITKAEAEKLLADGLRTFEAGVTKACKPSVPNQAQFDAMVSLAYNIGLANFRKSSILSQFKAGNMADAAQAFNLWCKARDPKTGKLVPLPGLVRRRAEESHLFLTKPSGYTQTRVQSNEIEIQVPEASVVPEAPKSLSKSREVIGGAVAATGGVGQIINSISVDDALAAKEKLNTVKEQPQTPFMQKYHIVEVAALLTVIISVFIIWKRFHDRKQGIR